MSSEFDRYATTYEKDLKDSMPAGLEENEYFARYKIEYAAAQTTGERIESILDFGCGAGRSMAYLTESFPKAVMHGFDPSIESIRIASEQFPQATLSANWDDVARFRYDLILAANVFHHIAADQIPLWLQRCGSVLSKGGSMFVFEHNPTNPLTRYVFERCAFDQDARMIRRRDLQTWAKHADLSVASARYTLFFPKPLRLLRPLERWLGWLPLGAQYCLRLRRGD